VYNEDSGLVQEELVLVATRYGQGDNMKSGVLGWRGWALMLILLLGAGLRFYQLAADGLWADEIITATFLQEPSLADASSNLMGRNGRPLFLAMTYPLISVSQNEFWLRFPSVLCGVLTIAIAYKIGQLLFGRREGLLSALLLAMSPLHVHYSQEFRSYALLVCLSLLSLYFLLRAWRTGRWHWWVGFALASILNLYTHYTAFLFLAAEMTACGLLFVWELAAPARTGKRHADAWKRRQLQRVAVLAISLLAIGLAFLPSLTHLRAFVAPQVRAAPEARQLQLTLEFASDLFHQLITDTNLSGSISATSWFFISLFFLGLLGSLLRRQFWALLWILTWLVMPFFVLFTVPSEHFFVVRHVLPILPLLLLVIARGITALMDGLRWLTVRWTPDAWARAWPAFVLVALILALLAITPLRNYYQRDKEGWREAAEYLRTHLQPGDLVVCDSIHYHSSGDSERPYRALNYYLGTAAGGTLVIREIHVADTVRPIAEEARSVWGLISGEIGRWQPDPEKAELIEFPWAKVIRIKDDDGTVLDRSIMLLETYLEFLEDGARADVQSQLEQLYQQRANPEETSKRPARAGETSLSDRELARSYAEVGQARREQGDREEAVWAFQQAVELEPGLAWYHMMLGNSLLEAGRPREALAAYEQVLVLKPKYEQNAWYHTWVGRAYRQDGDLERAIQSYERALALDEDNVQAIKWLERLRP
jgi:tetratricopeptide (TPR) repeat protein